MSLVTPPVLTPPIPIVPESSSSPLIDPTLSHSSDEDQNKPQRNKRTRQQRSLKKSNKKILIKRTTPKAETPPPPPSLLPPPPPVKNKEPNGPGRPKSPIKKVETSPEPDHKSNNSDNKMVKRLSEMVIHLIFIFCDIF